MNGLDILVLLVLVCGGCTVAYYWGLHEGREQMLAERIEDLLGQERRRDEVALHHLDGDPTNNDVENLTSTRNCSVCGGPLVLWRGLWWHQKTDIVARGRHAPVPGPYQA